MQAAKARGRRFGSPHPRKGSRADVRAVKRGAAHYARNVAPIIAEIRREHPGVSARGVARELERRGVGRRVKKNKVLPFKAVLVDEDGNVVTDLVAPPVIQVIFQPDVGSSEDVTDDALMAGKGTDGNQFELSGDKWQFNLKTKNYSAVGTYTTRMESGDTGEYVIDPTCEGVFVIE